MTASRARHRASTMRGREIWACPNVHGRAGEQTDELVQSGAAQEIYDHACAARVDATLHGPALRTGGGGDS
jgi:hypothetical protein